MRVGLLVNPTAGKGRAADLAPRAAARLVADGHEVRDLSGPDATSARERARSAVNAGELDVLVVVGGDGMAHLGVNVVAGTDVALAVVAAGSGNDNARELGLPIGDPERAAGLVSTGSIRRLDLGRVVGTRVGDTVVGCADERWFLGVLGAGFDAVVNERAQSLSWPRGPRRYDLAVLIELPRFRPIPYVVTLDGERVETDAMLVAVGNAPAFGGGMRICPDASYDDGRLDVCIVRGMRKARFLWLFPTVFRGTHPRFREVQIRRCTRVRLEAGDARRLVPQADGERLAPLPLEVEVVPGALRLVVP